MKKSFDLETSQIQSTFGTIKKIPEEWYAVEPEYQADQLSQSQNCRRHQ